MNGTRLSGEGDSDCVVVLESGGRAVRKIFHSTPRQDGPRAAHREFWYLHRYSRALADAEGVACPEPLVLSLEPTPMVRMASCPGMPVDRYVRDRPVTAAALAALADRMAMALHRYVAVFDEPHYDFFYRNMLYDEDSDTVFLFDMGIPARLPELMAGLPPVAVSLGVFAGHVLRDLVQWRRVVRLVGNRRALRLTGFLIQQAIGHQARDADARRSIRTATLRSYRRTTGTGTDRAAPVHRRAWYRAAELLLVRPLLRSLLRASRPPQAAGRRPSAR